MDLTFADAPGEAAWARDAHATVGQSAIDPLDVSSWAESEINTQSEARYRGLLEPLRTRWWW